MFPKPPRPEPPRKAVPTMVVQQRATGAVGAMDTKVIVVPTPATGSGVRHPADIAGVQALDVEPVRGL